MARSSFSKLLPLLLTSLIWFAIGWQLHSWRTADRAQATLLPAQARILKAQTLLLNHQLRAHDALTGTLAADALSEAAIDGMLAWSQDAHADLYGPAAAARYELDVKGLTGVPGYWFDIVDGEMVVTDVPADTPAATAGLQVGDILVSADGVIFTPSNAGNEASFLQRGPIGSILDLQVKRGNELLSFQIPRQQQQFVRSRVLDARIGYLDLDLFISEIDQKVEQELQGLLKQGIEGFIWDLRRNDGGSVDAMRNILSYFIPQGVLYRVQLSDGSERTFEATGAAFVPAMPIVILVDQFTNSSAEIATDAMLAYRQAQIMGERTAGKGTVQDTVRLDESYLLHYTVAQWFTGDGQSIEGAGILPATLVKDNPETATDEALAAAVAYLEAELQR